MPTVLYLRGVPGTGKHTVARILERDLGWPRLWVHHFDAIYRIIGEHRVPDLTDKLFRDVADYLMQKQRDFIIVRPSRQTRSMESIAEECRKFGYSFLPVRLTASYDTLLTRVTRRWHESDFRVNSKAGLDEYLGDRKEEEFPGEHVVNTDKLTPEDAAAQIRKLIGA